MTNHEIAMLRIEQEIAAIPASLLPTNIAERACMAAFVSEELSAITTKERDALLVRIRRAEMLRFTELLESAA